MNVGPGRDSGGKFEEKKLLTLLSIRGFDKITQNEACNHLHCNIFSTDRFENTLKRSSSPEVSCRSSVLKLALLWWKWKSLIFLDWRCWWGLMTEGGFYWHYSSDWINWPNNRGSPRLTKYPALFYPCPGPGQDGRRIAPLSDTLSVILTSRKYISGSTLYVRPGYCLHCQYWEYGLSILDMSAGMSNTVMKKIVVIPTTRKPALSFQSLGKVWFRFHPFLFVDSELFKYFLFYFKIPNSWIFTRVLFLFKLYFIVTKS